MKEPAEISPSGTDLPWRRGGRALLLGIIAICVLIELSLQAADYGLIGPSYLRGLAYQNGAFWSGLLRDWRPNFAVQPVTMFATYAFLHAGIVHLIVNMITLWSLGLAMVDRIGAWRFAVIYVVSAIGGGAGFGLLSQAAAPMVGASGALFGLAGAWLAWEYLARHAQGLSRLPVLWSVVWLTLFNVILWWLTNGQLAWETHLGGAVAGAVAGVVLRPED